MTFIIPPYPQSGLIVWLPGDMKGESAHGSGGGPAKIYDRSGYSHEITQDLATGGGIYTSELIGGRGVLQMWNPGRAGGAGPTAAHVTYTQTRPLNLQPTAKYDGSYSITFWIVSTESSGSASTATTSDNNPFVCSKHAGGGSGSPARRYRINIRGASSGKVQFTVGGTSSNVMVESSGGVTDGNLHHVACVRNVTSGDTRIYIDGVSDANSTLVAGHDSYNTSNLAVGGPNDSENGSPTGSEVDGWLGDFRIYKRALSGSEVWSLYDARTRFDDILRERSGSRLAFAFLAGADDVQSPPPSQGSVVNVHTG